MGSRFDTRVPFGDDFEPRLQSRGSPPSVRERTGPPPPTTWTMIGNSPTLAEVMRQLEMIARSDASVLIQGETGSGKELAAHTIHDLGTRRDAPFVAVNCGAIPESLVETELFGHGRGAFTDAREARPGVIAQADAGTLFLDEADALSPKAQVALLRFLQDLRYRPVGAVAEVSSDVRVIAASNRDLRTLVDDGLFRKDLLYRLNIFDLWLPPLRERPADIELLANHFVRVFSSKYGIAPKQLHPAAVEWLRRYDWPGNVRELENWVHRAVLVADGDYILQSGSLPRRTAEAHDAPADLRTAKARALAAFESEYVARALATARGNVTAAARLAGTERRSFGRLVKKYGIDKARYQS